MTNTNQEAVNQQNAINLPNFEGSIKIEVHVQDIFEKLKAQFPEDYKHAHLVSHAIIGTAINSNGLSLIYNALNGYSPEIDFKVGDKIVCSEHSRRVYIPAALATNDSPATKADRRLEAIEDCEITEINLYTRDKIRVKFEQDNYDGTGKEYTHSWVNHRNCTKWVQSDDVPSIVSTIQVAKP